MRPPLSVQRALVLLIAAAAVAAVSVVCSIIAIAHMNSAIGRLRDLGFTTRDVRELRENIGGSLTSIVVLSALVTVLVAIGAMVVRRPSGRARLVVSFGAGIGAFLTFVTFSASPDEFTPSTG